jgi:hypothetical protein
MEREREIEREIERDREREREREREVSKVDHERGANTKNKGKHTDTAVSTGRRCAFVNICEGRHGALSTYSRQERRTREVARSSKKRGYRHNRCKGHRKTEHRPFREGSLGESECNLQTRLFRSEK